MTTLLLVTAAAVLGTSPSVSADPADDFLRTLRGHCGKAYAGQLVNPQPADSAMLGQALVMHVRECGDTVRVPFHVGANRSRTWVFTRTGKGARLKHDHRHEDGSEDRVTQYGGDAVAGTRAHTASHLEFAADSFTAAMLPTARTNVWTVEVTNSRFSYQLRRDGTDRRFRVDFDLTKPITPPAAPWGASSPQTRSDALSLWKQGGSAFGIFVPSERAPNATDANGQRLPALYTEQGAQALAANPLLDYLFLNLEGQYDLTAVRNMVAGIAKQPAAARPTLLVRIPTIEAAGVDSTRARVKAVLAAGANGVVIPHVRSADEAKVAVSFFKDAGANVWSRANASGTVVAMLMIEDPGAVAELDAMAAVPGYSLLSCGIGSLTQAMGGREKAAEAEAACQRVRDTGVKAGMPSMMTANGNTLRDRITRGYQGLLLMGATAQTDSLIRVGRAAVGR